MEVTFQVNGSAQFGSTTGAQIKVKTILGAMYLALIPDGSGQMKEGAEIPVDAHQVAVRRRRGVPGPGRPGPRDQHRPACQGARHDGRLTKNTPADFQSALQGVSALSANVAARDAQLQHAAAEPEEGVHVLGDRRDDIVTLMGTATRCSARWSPAAWPCTTCWWPPRHLSTQLTGLVQDTRADLKPALDNLEKVVDLLNSNQENLDASLRLMAPFYRVFANTLGDGPWFDTIIKNFPPTPVSADPRRPALPLPGGQ